MVTLVGRQLSLVGKQHFQLHGIGKGDATAGLLCEFFYPVKLAAGIIS